MIKSSVPVGSRNPLKWGIIAGIKTKVLSDEYVLIHTQATAHNLQIKIIALF